MGHYAWDGTYNEDGSDHMVWVADAADKAEENFRKYGDSRGPGHELPKEWTANGYTLGDYMAAPFNKGVGTYADSQGAKQAYTPPMGDKEKARFDKLLADKLKADGVVKAASADLSNLTPSKGKKTSKWGWWNK